jgi:hypothetical protein
MGPARARMVLEWESVHTGLLQTGAVVALLTGVVMALAVTTRSSDERRRIVPK